MAAWCSTALADGKVFAPVGAVARIPDQQALIHFADGVETLVIETRFDGTGSEFAWVVPVPAVPAIEPTTTGLFPTLRTVFAPRVVQRSSTPGWLLLWCTVIVVAAMTGRDGLSVALGGSCIMLVWIVLFMPLGAPRGHRGITAAPDIHARQVVGAFDTVTLSGGSDSVITWLNQNDFAVDPTDESTIAAYARDGWVFVASRLRRDDSGRAISTPHPLCFRFPAERPVYPLRLTALAGDAVTVDLYVFGPGRASATGFTVARCSTPIADAGHASTRAFHDGAVRLNHAELRRLVPGTPVATKLTATLRPADMARDAVIRFEPFRASGEQAYTPAAVIASAWNIGSAVLLTGTIVMAGVLATRGREVYRRCGRLAAPSVVAGIAGLGVYVSLPVTPVERQSFRNPFESLHMMVYGQLDDAAREAAGRGAPMTLDSLRQLARAAYAHEREAFGLNMPVDEDSPGNYLIRQATPGFEHVLYDAGGTEHAFPIGP